MNGVGGNGFCQKIPSKQKQLAVLYIWNVNVMIDSSLFSFYQLIHKNLCYS